MSGMVVLAADDRANRHELVHDPREVREQLTDFNARHGSRNGIELAADFRRSIDLDLIHVLMRRPTAQVDHDQRLMPLAFLPDRLPGLICLCILEGQKLRERESSKTQSANPDEV